MSTGGREPDVFVWGLHPNAIRAKVYHRLGQVLDTPRGTRFETRCGRMLWRARMVLGHEELPRMIRSKWHSCKDCRK